MTNRTAPTGTPATAIGARLRVALPVERMGTAGFTGRWAGGTAMVLGPALMLAGALLRVRFHFFYPDQLAAYERHSTLMATAYGLFAAGTVLLWPAVAVLAARIGVRSPGWGLWGGVVAVFGLFARTFHAGVDHLAFQLVRSRGAGAATEAVSVGYGAFHVFSALNLAVVAGWIVLALGAWRTGVLGLIARGLSNTELAQHLRLSPATVKTHIGRLLAKLRARDRAQLAIVAYETGLVDARGRDGLRR
ncbi:response regulator transcription factor [Streptomyces sp. NPDC001890]|uniref:helix-turn-helix transcriptional regulator n=1 Tax=Streptomyces sp. NPDC001890 TaxID=3364620 RepID=UPI0036B41020